MKLSFLALFEVGGRDYKSAIASDLGFAVGPRLNAAGRLDDMSTGIECLRSRDMIEARQRAQRLHALNQERKNIEDEMRRDAEALLADSKAFGHGAWHRAWLIDLVKACARGPGEVIGVDSFIFLLQTINKI